jgi:hypothetical protein
MLQVVDMVSSFYLKDLSSCYSYGRLYRQHTIGWEGYRSAECNKRAVKRRGSVEAAKQAPNVSFRNGSINESNLGGFCLFLLIYPGGGRGGTSLWTFIICLTSCYIKSQTIKRLLKSRSFLNQEALVFTSGREDS